MKILFWLFAIASIPAGLFMSCISWLSRGLGLYQTVVGEVIDVLGMFSVVVSIVCAVLGIIKLRKGDLKKAFVLALVGVAYSGVILAGVFIDEAVHSVLLEKSIEDRNEQVYGEGWDANPAIEGIPELYQELLNKYYVVVRDRWPAENLMDLGAIGMADYYGEDSLDNIGFSLMDVNGDNSQELLVGTTASAQEGGTVIFCIYSDPENPFYAINSVEGDVYYLHSGETDGTYLAEIGGADAGWLLSAVEGEAIVDINYQEGALDPASRLTLEMIPFSRYK